MAARTPRPVVSDTAHTTYAGQDNFLTHQAPWTSTPLTTEGQVGQMSGIVQQIGQQLIVIITALLQYSFLSLFFYWGRYKEYISLCIALCITVHVTNKNNTKKNYNNTIS